MTHKNIYIYNTYIPFTQIDREKRNNKQNKKAKNKLIKLHNKTYLNKPKNKKQNKQNA